MGIFTKLFGSLDPEHRADFADTIRPRRRLPNSNDGPHPNIGRILTSERRVATRNMDELLGMVRMILADGVVEDAEAKFLLNWIEHNFHARNEWPGNILYDRLATALANGHLDKDEESELLEVLGKVGGGPPSAAGPSVSGAIPFDVPAPPILFKAHLFALTGQFVFGPRSRIEKVIEHLGGMVAPSVSGKCGYLIVGTFGSEEWLHSNYGTKIVKAVELKAAGKALRIVSEQHWTEQLEAAQGVQ